MIRRRGWLLLLALGACSGAPLPHDLELAQAREAARDDAGALALYRLVRAECERPGARPRPKDDCALAILREAQILEKQGKLAEAKDAFLLVARRTTQPRRAARALVRAATLMADDLGDPAGAEQIAWRAVEELPDEMGADDALALAIRLGERRDPVALAERLAKLAPRVARLDLGDNVAFARAELARKTFQQPAAAVALYDQLIADYPRSSLRDDAIWQAAQLLRQNGDPRGAIKRLRLILDFRKDALITGSYNSLYLDDAQLLVGTIYLDDLGEVDRAIEAFRTLADDYPESILKDDGLFELARAHLRRHDPPRDEDRRAACKALARLLSSYPDSNRRRAAEKLHGDERCPTS